MIHMTSQCFLILCLQNRFYITTKLKTDLDVELKSLFVALIADKHVPTLIRKQLI